MSPSESQLFAISTTERVCSAVSLAATSIIIVSFICSGSFRKPFNRLVFYASWGNIMANLATVISREGIHAGRDSPLCQFQAFLIQWFIPADALWALAMACNVYLTFFRKYDSDQLRRLEWKYCAFCYGLPFIPAFVYFFIHSRARGKIYGSAILWCWITPSWDFLRIAILYGPVWFIIFLTLAIYVRTGCVIYQRRQQLHQIGIIHSNVECQNLNEPISSKTTEISITREEAASNEIFRSVAGSSSRVSFYIPYSVTIEGGQCSDVPLKSLRPEQSDARLQRRAIVTEANTAAWAYTKYAMLFFMALIITWVPSTANRVYALVFPESFNFALNYLAGLVIPLQGFWNSIIYISVSWPAFKSVFNKHRRSRGLLRMEDTDRLYHNVARNHNHYGNGSAQRLTA